MRVDALQGHSSCGSEHDGGAEGIVVWSDTRSAVAWLPRMTQKPFVDIVKSPLEICPSQGQTRRKGQG